MSRLDPGDPAWSANLVLALAGLAQRIDELEELCQRLGAAA